MAKRRIISVVSPDEELRNVVDAARLYFIEQKTQSQVAKELNASQSSVSRWLYRAQTDQLVDISIRVPYLFELQDKLSRYLNSKADVDCDCIVVPNSEIHNDKNTHNIGEAAGRAFLDAICDSDKTEISVVLSCGETLRVLVDFVIKRTKSDKDLQAVLKSKKIKLYPAALFSDSHFATYYPHTLITVLMLGLRQEVDNITAYVHTLPPKYYESTPVEQKSYRSLFQIDQYLKEVQSADICLFGIGVVNDEDYQSVISNLNIKPPIDLSNSNQPELCYVPLDSQGRSDKRVTNKIIGLNIEDIQEICRTKDSTVIVFGGGRKKRDAICSFVNITRANRKPYTTIITDADVAKQCIGDDGGF